MRPRTKALAARHARQAWAWALDYLYAARWQLHALFRPRPTHRFLQDTDPAAAPVVLIPGIYETWQFMYPVALHLHGLGHPVHVVGGFGYNRGTVPAMAELVARHLADRGLQGALLVAHSKGGLIGKYVMSASPEAGRVSRLVAINTPFSGSVYARYSPWRSLRAFSPRDEGLLRLARNLDVNAHIVSIYSRFDPHIPGGSYLDGAVNLELDTMGHFRIIGDPRLMDALRRVLGPDY